MRLYKRGSRAPRICCSATPAALALALAVAVAGTVAAQTLGAAPLPASAPATFKPTQSQLAALGVTPVIEATFRSERLTDGKIAFNGDRATPVFSPFSGRVRQVLAGLGDRVHQGQPLLTVQASELVQGQNDLLATQAAAASAGAQLSQAQRTEQRKHALFDAGAGSLQDWQQSQGDLAAAQAAAQTAAAAASAARNRLAILGKTDAEIDALARGETVDALARVLAPIDGTIIDKQVGQGQYLQAGSSTPVYTVADLASVWLVANVREADAPFLRVGDLAEVHVAALPRRVFTARISYLAASLDPATRRLAVRAEIANPEGVLRPEMFARFSIVAPGQTRAPAVPESGVIYEGSAARVWVVGDDGSLALRDIRPGRSANGLLEVLEGVKPGEKVVSSGALFIDRAAQGD
jgi:cobalt-zinc-cadmium efflux system membrane fusion protein